MDDTELWWWADPDGVQELVTRDELRSGIEKGNIPANAPVWREGWSNWRWANEVSELKKEETAKSKRKKKAPPPLPASSQGRPDGAAAHGESKAEMDDELSEKAKSRVPGLSPMSEPPKPPSYLPQGWVRSKSSAEALLLMSERPAAVDAGGGVAGPVDVIVPKAPMAPKLDAEAAPESRTSSEAHEPTPSQTQEPQSVEREHALQLAAQVEPKAPEVPVVALPSAELPELPEPPMPSTKVIEEPKAAPVAARKVSERPVSAAKTEPSSEASPLERASSKGAPVSSSSPTDAQSSLVSMATAVSVPTIANRPEAERSEHESSQGSSNASALSDGDRSNPALSSSTSKVMPAVHLPGSAGRKASAGRWPVFLAAGLVLAIGIQKGSEIASRAVGSGGDVSCPVIRDNTPISSTLEPLESPQNGGPCKVQGPGALVESSVSISAGVEALAVADTFALGFTKANNKEAIVADMDPGSWRPRKSTKSSDNGTILRVVPDERGADFQPLVDGRKKDGDLLRDRMLVSGAFPFDMATRGGNLVWGHRGKADTKELWELPAGVTKGLSAVRSAPFGRDERIFVAKLENRLLLGRLRMNPEPEARGHLEAVESAAATLGTPTIAVSGDTVMIAYPEKFLPGDPWRIRLARWKPGVGCPVPSTFVPPRGGLGVHTMAPSLAALPQGGFLLAWTEGPVGNHQVRAQAIGLEGEPDGPALEISRASVNAGQSSVAVGPSGIAGVAYFEGINESYKLMAVPLRCDGTQR